MVEEDERKIDDAEGDVNEEEVVEGDVESDSEEKVLEDKEENGLLNDDGKSQSGELVGEPEIEDQKTEGEPTELDLKSSENLGKKQNSQIKWSIFLMISLIVIILVVPAVVKYYFNNFEYIGIEFQKTKLGDLVFYSTKFPVIGIQGNVIGSYSMNFRTDPRDLEYIPVDVEDDKIKFVQIAGGGYTPVYISLDPSMEVCEDSVIAMVNLAEFLKDSSLEVRSAVTDKAYAEERDENYMTCETSKSDTVILIKDGEETSITEVGPNCYQMIFKDCEILQVSEKFMLIILEEYADKFRKDDEAKGVDLNKKGKKEVVKRTRGLGTEETRINIETLPNHEIIVRTLDPSPEKDESDGLEYFVKKSGNNGNVSVMSYVNDSVIDITVILEKEGERVEVNGETLHKFIGEATGGIVNLEIKELEIKELEV